MLWKIAIATLVLLLILPAASALNINPSIIEEELRDGEQKTLTVRVTNPLNSSISVSITKSSNIHSYVTVNPESFSLDAFSFKDVSIILSSGTYSGKLYYTWSNSTHSGTVEQSISVTTKYEKIRIYPKRIDVDVPENETLTLYIAVVNPSSKTVSIDIDYSRPVRDISDTHFTLEPYESKVLEVEVSGSGRGEIRYSADGYTIEQEVKVESYKPRSVIYAEERLKQIESEKNELLSKLYLPEVKIEVGEKHVGKPMEVKVLGRVNNNWVGMEKVLVGFEDNIKFTDSSGVVYFTPSEAGLSKVTVYDREGNVKKEILVNISKAEYRIPISGISVGENFKVELPEPGTISIYREGVKVETIDVEKEFEYAFDRPGRYTLQYDSKSYTGETKVDITGDILISATVNGQEVKPGDTVYGGDTVVFTFTYPNGVPAKDVEVEIGLPATAYGLTKEMAVFLALLGSDVFSPPYNIVSRKEVDGSLTLIIPEKAEGVLTVGVEEELYSGGSSFVINVKPKPPNILAPFIFVCALGLLLSAIAYKKDIWGFNVRIKNFVGRWRVGKHEPPE